MIRNSVYSVIKTEFNRYPVYTDIKRKNEIRTLVRRINGDIVQMRNDLQLYLLKKDRKVEIAIMPTSYSLRMNGSHGKFEKSSKQFGEMLRRLIRCESLFVGQLPYNTTKADIENLFPCQIENITLPKSSEMSGCKGFAFIDFKNEEDAHALLKEHATKKFELSGRILNLDLANSPNRKKPRFERQLSETTDTLYVGNLPFSVEEDELKALFGSGVESCQVKKDIDGRSFGYAFITFGSIEDAKSALKAKEGLSMQDRTIRIDFAKKRVNYSE